MCFCFVFGRLHVRMEGKRFDMHLILDGTWAQGSNFDLDFCMHIALHLFGGIVFHTSLLFVVYTGQKDTTRDSRVCAHVCWP